MTRALIQEIKDTWEQAIVPLEHAPYRMIGEPSLTLAKDDILALLHEVKRLEVMLTRARALIADLYWLTEETP